MTYGRSINKALAEFNIGVDEWPDLSANRSVWRARRCPLGHPPGCTWLAARTAHAALGAPPADALHRHQDQPRD